MKLLRGHGTKETRAFWAFVERTADELAAKSGPPSRPRSIPTAYEHRRNTVWALLDEALRVGRSIEMSDRELIDILDGKADAVRREMVREERERRTKARKGGTP